MNDEGSNQSTGAVATAAFQSSADSPGLKLASISDESSLHFATSLGRVARLLLMTLVLILLLPVMLILTVFSIMVTRGLGVPLYGPSSSPISTMKKR